MTPRIDLAPLRRGAAGGAIRIAGVAVGEPAAGIDRSALTGAEETDPGEPRIYADGTVYREVAGRRVEVPLAARVAATIAGGGVLRVDDVALEVRAGRIERIFVRGAALDRLGLARLEDVERDLGPATGTGWELGARMFHYPERQLSVAWNARAGRLDHVALGPVEWRAPRLGARDLVAELLAAWSALAPDDWAEPRDGAARVRYLRIAALARALGLGPVSALVDGAFLDGEFAAGRRAVYDELARRSGLRDTHAARPTPAHEARPWLFRCLLAYRHDVHRVVRATDGWLECSDVALLGMIEAQRELGGRIEALMADVDRWLCTLLDPDARTFTERELIERHGWPDVDLHAIELDEL